MQVPAERWAAGRRGVRPGRPSEAAPCLCPSSGLEPHTDFQKLRVRHSLAPRPPGCGWGPAGRKSPTPGAPPPAPRRLETRGAGPALLRHRGQRGLLCTRLPWRWRGKEAGGRGEPAGGPALPCEGRPFPPQQPLADVKSQELTSLLRAEGPLRTPPLQEWAPGRAEERGGKMGLRPSQERAARPGAGPPGRQLLAQVLAGDKVGGQRAWLTRWVPEMSSGELPTLSGGRPTSPPGAVTRPGPDRLQPVDTPRSDRSVWAPEAAAVIERGSPTQGRG